MESKKLGKRGTIRLVRQIAAKYHGDKFPNPIAINLRSDEEENKQLLKEKTKHWEIIEENESIIWQRETKEGSDKPKKYKLELKLYSFPNDDGSSTVLGHLYDEEKEPRTKVSRHWNKKFWNRYKEKGSETGILIEEDGYAFAIKNENPEKANKYRIMVTRL
tara:strand:- start:854 stop:1339 length:486 start_codon:yes stop_codon:yes gene_type:complete